MDMRKSIATLIVSGSMLLGNGVIVGCIEQNNKTAPVQKNFSKSKSMLSDKELEFARAKPQYRQSFLDKLLEENPIPLCKGIVYDPGFVISIQYSKNLAKKYNFTLPETDIMDIDGVAAMVPNHTQILGRQIELPIYVNNAFFDASWRDKDSDKSIPIVGNLDDAISTLVNHEGQHVKDGYTGFVVGDRTITHEDFPGPLYPAEFLVALNESRAYYNQLMHNRDNPSISKILYYNTVHNSQRHFARILQVAESHDEDLSHIAKLQRDYWGGVRGIVSKIGEDDYSVLVILDFMAKDPRYQKALERAGY